MSAEEDNKKEKSPIKPGGTYISKEYKAPNKKGEK